MLFNSFNFLIFFSVVLLIYYWLPLKYRKMWLLAASYYFYLYHHIGYGIIIVTVTVVTYAAARIIEKISNICIKPQKAVLYKKICLIICFIISFGFLFYYKYSSFFFKNLNYILKYTENTTASIIEDIILPIGISFFTFQSFGYVVDVYRGNVCAEKNVITYALFVVFFPTITSGPIERSSGLLKQLNEKIKFEWKNIRSGFYQLLWGYFLKLVIADRIAIFVNQVYGQKLGGIYIILATLLFGVQIYCDFAGYSAMATGVGRMLGFRLIENFRTPYLAVSVSDFWRRWHISLSSWFRDYLYIPLGGNRKGSIRKYLNIMIVFLVSGIWHGAGWKYIIWGGLHGIYQIIGAALKPIRMRVKKYLHIRENTWKYIVWQRMVTFGLVDFAWLFFRADSAGGALQLIKKALTEFTWQSITDGSLYMLGLSKGELGFVLCIIIILFAIDILHEKGIYIFQEIEKRCFLLSGITVAGLIMAIITLGVYGVNYDVGTFIYFAF